MSEPEWIPLRLGADVVQMLLPHRRPFLFVHGIDAIAEVPRPSLRARGVVSANDPVFEGHFPGLALWPGVYTIEGLGQTTNLLNLFVALLEGLRAHGGEPAQLYEALRAIDARARMGGRAPTEIETKLIEALGEPRARIGYAGAIDVKLIEPVFAGATIEYRATLTHVLANAKRFDVEARVDDRAVARGSITSATPGR
ncbi:MAG TPA: 3-hydroxyacyl-ACP dehydratase FabZ family protein [Sandaracinaceae bacterium]